MQAFKHDAPTLGILNTAFGTETANAWLIPELVAVSEFCGCRDKLTDGQLEETARIITASYPWLKVSELLLFFGWLKQGKYGRFYGCLDPMVITTSLQDFICDRALYLEKVAQQERDKQAEEEKKKPHFTREEWEKMKQQKQEE